uniref:ATP synthase F0 subunit 8 n=1 Tax=Titiscania limacina TaxID=200181 RepID=A0A1B2G3G9_9GAST|nr:ATP synthase F0 subunit 8 [Titiscania limacina]
MPQLSPLNWLFLFSLSWFGVALTVSSLWWYNSSLYINTEDLGLTEYKKVTGVMSGPWFW